MRIVMIAATLLVLSGCAATGPGIEPQQATVLQKGRTTYEEVARRFGRPSINSKNMDGTRTAIYLQPGDDEPGAVVSLMSTVAGTRLETRERVTFEFDEKDILTDYRWTQAKPAEAPNPAAASAPYPMAPASATPPATAQPAPAASSPSATALPPQPAQAGTGTPPAPAATSAAPRKPPARKRDDGLPAWLPSSSTYDPRNPF